MINDDERGAAHEGSAPLAALGALGQRESAPDDGDVPIVRPGAGGLRLDRRSGKSRGPPMAMFSTVVRGRIARHQKGPRAGSDRNVPFCWTPVEPDRSVWYRS